MSDNKNLKDEDLDKVSGGTERLPGGPPHRREPIGPEATGSMPPADRSVEADGFGGLEN